MEFTAVIRGWLPLRNHWFTKENPLSPTPIHKKPSAS